MGELDLAELSLQGVILASGVGEKSAKFPCGGACARLPLVSQANPVLIFVTHCWENSDDYLRVFEYLESQRNFFYRNYSTPEQRPQGDKEALRESLRKQIAPSEAVIGLSSLFDAHQELLTFQLRFAQASHKPVVLMKPFGVRKDVPKALRDLANEVVDWDERALVDAIRRQARHEETTRWDTIEFKLD
ncbi:MAG: hypothetical protein E6K24_08050 [Gammaproteobacteria bacterium]|nr:MAG: hypothetical protein E6K24_08050 [Gammaproteobacteria bacterium]